MNDQELIIEPQGSSGSAVAGWAELLQKFNPEFLENNKDLIFKAIELFSNRAEADPDMVSLNDLGFESIEDLSELIDVVPRYNELIDEFDGLEEAYQALSTEMDAITREFKLLAEKNKRLTVTLKKARKFIMNLKSANQQLKLNNQALKLQLGGRKQELGA